MLVPLTLLVVIKTDGNLSVQLNLLVLIEADGNLFHQSTDTHCESDGECSTSLILSAGMKAMVHAPPVCWYSL